MGSYRPFISFFHTLSAPIRGALWMLLSAACFSILSGMIRHISENIHPFEIAFFRSAFGLVILLPWLMKSGLQILRTRRIGTHLTRCAVGAMTMLLWFYGLSIVPLADATALGFTNPLFVTIGAALFLGEVIKGPRIIAVLLGFAGTLIILRPGGEVVTIGAGIILFSAFTMAIAHLLVKDLARTEPTQAVVTYMVIFMSPLTLIPALFVWTTPTLGQTGLLFILAALATLGNFSMTRAVTVADASAVMPYDFARLPFAALIGMILFSEFPDFWTWVGAAIIAGSSVFISYREAKAAKRARQAQENRAAPP